LRTRIALLILLFLFCQIAISAFPRPWHDQAWLVNNPNILYASNKDIWFPGLLNIPINELRLDKIKDIGDSNFKSLINTAIKNKEETSIAAKKCADVYADIQKNPTKKLDEILNKSAGDALNGASVGAAAGALIFGLPSGGVFSVPGAVVGGIVGAVVGGAIGGLSNIFGALFSNTKDDRIIELAETCSEYGKKWRALMDSAIDAIDYSFKELENKWNEAADAYKKLKYTGVCDNDYYSTGREACNYIEDIMETGANGKYGTSSQQIIKLQNDLKSGFSKSLPNTTAYSELIDIIWNDTGAIKEAESIVTLAEQKLNEAEDDTKVLFQQTEELEAKANKKLDELKKQIPEKITASFVISETLSNEKKETISNMFIEIKTNVEQAAEEFDDAKKTYMTKKLGYIKNSVTVLKDIEKTYHNIDGSINTINDKLKEMVEEKQKEASTLLEEFEKITKDNFIHDEATKNYEKAKVAFEKANDASALGDKFEYFDQAATNVRFAINIFENKPLEKIVSIKAAISDVKKLIKAAENDGIDASYENEEIKLIEKTEQTWVLENVKNIENSILTKAKILYGNLENKRKELLKQIKLGKEATADLKTTLAGTEQDAFYSDGRINYRKAIGKLKEIRNAYNEIEVELGKSRKDIVLNALEKTSDLSFDIVELDKPTDIKIIFAVSNNLGFSAENTAIDFEFPYDLEIFKSDMNDDNDVEVIKTKGRIKIILSKIEPYANYIIKIEKQEILARSINKRVSAVGNADGSANIEENIDFELEINAAMWLGDEVEIDGLQYNGAELEKGKHKLERRYKIDGAYQIKTENYHANKIGLKTKVEFDYIIDSVIDLQTVTIYAQLNNEKIKDLDIVSLSGERLNNIKKLDNGIVLFDVNDIDADSDAIVRVIYNIEDVSDYINEKIALFDSYNLSNDDKLRLEEAKDKFTKNDSETALKKIVEIERNIEKDNGQKQKSEVKHQKLVNELNNELRKLERALENAKGKNVSSEINEKIELRITEINGSLNNYKIPSEDAIEKLAQLEKSYEKNLVNELRKKLSEEFNDLKERIFKIGILEMPSSFKDVENALIAAKDTQDLNDIIEAAEKLENAKLDAQKLEKERSSKQDALGNRIDEIKNRLKKSSEIYKKQAKDAKSTKYAYLFDIDTGELDKKIKNLEKNLGNTDELEKTEIEAEDIEEIVSNLENDARNKLANLENIFNAAQLSGEEKNKIRNKLARMRELIDNGEYINALKASDIILGDLKKAGGGGDNSLIILGATALLIIAALVVYMFKFSGKKERPREFKKLKKAGD